MIKKILLLFSAFVFGVWLSFAVFGGGKTPPPKPSIPIKENSESSPANLPEGSKKPDIASAEKKEEEKIPEPEKIPVFTSLPEKSVLLDVPFTSQAPFRNWKDPRQQDGCEEAAALMAVAWARGESLTPGKSLDEILAISKYQEQNYGNFHDTDAENTAEIIYRGYFGYGNIEVRHQIGIEDIKQELFKGNLVVVPTNGRKLGNPYYTPPGPLEHNLVIRGYDPVKKEFITNDPGIMSGGKYRYKESVLAKALLDYPTGYHEPVVEGRTAMIVVKKAE